MANGHWGRVRGATFAVAFLLSMGVAHAATQLVNPAGTDSGNCQGSACKTITYALGQASNGDTIQIAAGTYTEQITINKQVTLLGASRDSTIIKAPASLVQNPVITPGAGDQKTAIVYVTGASTVATLRNLQVSGPGSTNCGSIGYGVFVGGNATLTLDTTRIKAIRDEPLSGCQNGRGVTFGQWASSEVGSGSVLNSIFEDFQKTAIGVYNAGSVVTIRNNTITGMDDAPNGQNGIDVYQGSSAVIEGNTVSHLTCAAAPCIPPNTDRSTGIGLDDVDAGTIVRGNHVNGADIDFNAYNISATIPVSNNTFENGRYVNVMAAEASLELKGNTLSGSLTGLQVWEGSNVSLNGGNIISGAADYGIWVEDSVATVQGSQNQFYGNGEGAHNDGTQATMSLTCNWWGAVTGPADSNNPLGTGNAINGTVTYTNWAVDNTRFLCVGNPARNEALAQTPAPVPVDAPWALMGAALALGGLGARALRRRRAS